VKSNITRFGEIEPCRFIKGWFDETMPCFSEPIVAAYIDVDLASSTRMCLRYLYPRIVPGGILYSQDGDFPLVIDVFRDDRFWEETVGYPKPPIEGLGKSKMLKIVKPAASGDGRILNKQLGRTAHDQSA
jgi:O-methyltransferase